MSPAALAGIAGLNLLGSASPGPDVLLATRVATKSRKHAYFTIAGTHIGVLLWSTLTVVGAAALFTAYPEIVSIVSLVGGAFIAIMGRGMLLSGLKQRNNPELRNLSASEQLGTPWRCLRVGLATNLANPKIVLFQAALIAPALPPSPAPADAALIIAALWLPSIALFTAFATVVSSNAVRRRLINAGPYIDIGAGLFFIVAGLIIAVAGVVELAAEYL